jgi:hypothetical protein
MSSKFIKLTHMILNTNYINKIRIYADFYYIYLTPPPDFKGITMFGFGALDAKNEEIIISAKKTPKDYQIISDWVEKEFPSK